MNWRTTLNVATKTHFQFSSLPVELENLIEFVGKGTHADQEEIDDMKAHLLNFINTQTNGFAVALNGFKELKTQIEFGLYLKNIATK